MSSFAFLISTFNRISLLDRFSVITTGDNQLVGFSTLSIMSSASSFSNSASSLGLTLNGILLWAYATGVIAGSACKSTFTPFIFPIPRNRSAYSFNRLLVIVSSLWTVFATLTRPRSSAVWKPIKSSVCMSLYNMKRGRGDSSVRLNNGLKFSHDLQWRRRVFVRLLCKQNTR